MIGHYKQSVLRRRPGTRNLPHKYYLNVTQQSACLVVNSITINKFAILLNYTPIDRVSDSGSVIKLDIKLVGALTLSSFVLKV